VLAAARAAVDQGVVIQSVDGVVLFCDARAGELLGIAHGAATGRLAAGLPVRVSAPDGTPIAPEVAMGSEALHTAKPPGRAVMRIGWDEGPSAWVTAAYRPLLDDVGRVWGVATSLSRIDDEPGTPSGSA
jgi:PAS domain-containing protein